MRPFNGATGANPYLVVTVNGKANSWYGHPFTDCSANPGYVCTGTVEIDPIPYAEPGAYYNSAGMAGTESNPFVLSNTVLYADPCHAGEWATRLANGIQEWFWRPPANARATAMAGSTDRGHRVRPCSSPPLGAESPVLPYGVSS